MAGQATFVFREKKKIKRKGRHSKKASLLKNSKTYKKLYRGQGK
tara:strand:- start:1788 stop:1919 length:132 start_codon:yes stop_codon:yes gene_type:complete